MEKKKKKKKKKKKRPTQKKRNETLARKKNHDQHANKKVNKPGTPKGYRGVKIWTQQHKTTPHKNDS